MQAAVFPLSRRLVASEASVAAVDAELCYALDAIDDIAAQEVARRMRFQDELSACDLQRRSDQALAAQEMQTVSELRVDLERQETLAYSRGLQIDAWRGQHSAVQGPLAGAMVDAGACRGQLDEARDEIAARDLQRQSGQVLVASEMQSEMQSVYELRADLEQQKAPTRSRGLQIVAWRGQRSAAQGSCARAMAETRALRTQLVEVEAAQAQTRAARATPPRIHSS